MDKDFLKKFVSGLTATGFGTFVQLLLGLISMIVSIRYLPKSDYGIYVLLEVMVVLLAVLGSLGLENLSVVKLMAGANEDRKVVIANTSIFYRFLLSTVLALVIIPLRPLVLYVFKSETLVKLTYFISIFIVLTGFQELFAKLLQAYHRYQAIAVSQILSGLLRLGGVGLFIVGLKMQVTGLILAYLVTMTGSVVYLYFALPFKKRIAFDVPVIKELFHFGLPLGLNNVLSFIFLKIDRIMLGIMLSPVGVAGYEVASRLPDNMARMYTAFQSVYFPNLAELFAKGKKHEAEKMLGHSLRILSFLTLGAALVGLLFQKDIMVLLFSVKYLDSAPAFALLMFCFSIALTGDVLGTSLVAFGQSDKPVKINLVDTVFNVAGNLLLIPRYGVLGAVFATLVSRAVTNPFIVYFLKKAGVKIEFRNYVNPILLFLLVASGVFLFHPKTILLKIIFLMVFSGLAFPYPLYFKKWAGRFLGKNGPAPESASAPRALVVSNLYPPHIQGGHELQSQFAAEVLAERGYEVHVLTSRYGLAKPGREENVHRLFYYCPERNGIPNRLAAFVTSRMNYWITRRIAVKVRPSLVYMGQLNGISIFPLKALNRLGIPVAHHIGHFFFCELVRYCVREPNLLKRNLARIVTGFYNPHTLDFRHMAVVSSSVREEHIRAGYPGENISIVPPMGVALQSIALSARRISRTLRREFRLLFVGRLTHVKGVHVALAALKRLRDSGGADGVVFHIVGEGDPEYKRRLELQARKDGLEETVFFDGFMNREQVTRAYDAADLLLAPSLEEPFGLTIIEAMARGVPVVASAVGGIKDIVTHQENGLLVEPGNSAELYRAIARLLGDAEEYNRISGRALQTVREKYTRDIVGETLGAYLQNAGKAKP